MLSVPPSTPTPPSRYVDLEEAIPRDPASGALDFKDFDFATGSRALPLVKLIDDFKVRRGLAGHGGGAEACAGPCERGGNTAQHARAGPCIAIELLWPAGLSFTRSAFERVANSLYLACVQAPRGTPAAAPAGVLCSHATCLPWQAAWDYLGSDGTTITLHTNAEAPRYRVVRGDMAAAGTVWAGGGPGLEGGAGHAEFVAHLGLWLGN